jgi:hemolysin activation/secretion protein
VGSGPNIFNLNRYGADGSFIYFRGDLSHTQDLPWGLQIFGKVQGQLANQPLVSSEEFSGGGVETLRGYLESEAVGDNGTFGSLELRSPSVLGWTGDKDSECRFYVFGDAGHLSILEPLPDQTARYTMSSVGIGSRLLLRGHLSGSCDAAYPLDQGTYTQIHDMRVTFRVALDF